MDSKRGKTKGEIMGLFGLFDKDGLLSKGLGTVDKAVINQDLKNQLQHDLVMKYADVMFQGPGAKITKWTLCANVSAVVGTILYTFAKGGDIDGVLAIATACGGVIGLMTGAFAYGTSQKRKWEATAANGGETPVPFRGGGARPGMNAKRDWSDERDPPTVTHSHPSKKSDRSHPGGGRR